jgi:hypothetical protein
MAEHFGALSLPVGEFLALEHGTEFVGYRRITVRPAFPRPAEGPPCTAPAGAPLGRWVCASGRRRGAPRARPLRPSCSPLTSPYAPPSDHVPPLPPPPTDDGVKSTPGHRFVTDRVARTRPRTPGEEVGQSLVLVTPSTPFADVIERIVQHRIHRRGAAAVYSSQALRVLVCVYVCGGLCACVIERVVQHRIHRRGKVSCAFVCVRARVCVCCVCVCVYYVCVCVAGGGSVCVYVVFGGTFLMCAFVCVRASHRAQRAAPHTQARGAGARSWGGGLELAAPFRRARFVRFAARALLGGA